MLGSEVVGKDLRRLLQQAPAVYAQLAMVLGFVLVVQAADLLASVFRGLGGI